MIKETARLVCGVLLATVATVSLGGQQQFPGKRKLGPEINTEEYREALPLVSADGTMLYFIREDQGQELLAKMKTEANGQTNAAIADMEKMLATTTDPAMRKVLEDAIKAMRPATPQTQRTDLGLVHQTIWVSERLPDGRWGAATRLPPPLSDDVATIWIGSVLPDNNTLLVGGEVSGGLLARWQRQAESLSKVPAGVDPFAYLFSAEAAAARDREIETSESSTQLFAWSHRTATGWTAPDLLKIRGFRNDSERLEIFLAPDGRHTFFSIHNSESIGNRDLYLSTLGNDGVWTKPTDLGRVVNTPSVEMSPFMAPDGKTLYFASDRPGGLGGLDLWLTRRLDETWQNWSAPQNLGPEVNTKENDINIAVDASGKFAFMAIGPTMKEDIYEFELPVALRPKPVAFVYGRVTDPDGTPLPAAIVYEFLKTGQGAGHAAAKAGDGKYQIALPIGEDYAFRAAAAGYVAVSDRIDLTKAKDGERFERNLILVPLEVGKPIRLNNVFFDTAKTELLPESTRELDRLVALLRQMPTLKIDVRGHTDSVDTDASNLALSTGRAASVVAYLVKAGIAPDRLQSKGFGESSPIATNGTEEGRKLNRRVEFVVLSR
jgi:outer membrane protein OmpA-like peptidoglycan-associated protein